MKLTPFLLVGAALVGTAQAQTPMPANEKAVWQMEYDWIKAYVDGDLDKAATYQAKGYLYMEPNGSVHPAADLMADFKSGQMHLDEASLHEAAVHITGDTAVVNGRIYLKGTGGGRPISEVDSMVDTLVRDGDSWKAVSTANVILGTGPTSAVIPCWRDGGGWLKRHDQFVEDAPKNPVDLLFVGDSITDFWRNRGKDVFQKYYGRYKTANIGISGDRTQHVIWRLDHGEVAGMHPKVIVLMIGTNNVGMERDQLTLRNTPEEAAEGVKAVVTDLRSRMPEAKILLLAVFPRSHLPTDPLRAAVAKINSIISTLDDGEHVHYLDIGPKFLTPDGVLTKEIMPDSLHPSPQGYEIWAQAIQPSLDQWMGGGS